MKGSRNVVLGETVKAASLVPATWADVGKVSYDAAVGKVGIRSSLAGQLPSRRYRERRATRFTAIGGSLLLTVIGITACSGGPPRQLPRFVSLAQASFQAGKGSLFAVRTLNAQGPIIESGGLPAGLAMHRSAGGTVISGVPSGASGGVYHVTLSVAGSTGRPTRQRLAIVVYQAPRLLVGSTSQWSAASQHMTFNMTATGYPNPTDHTCREAATSIDVQIESRHGDHFRSPERLLAEGRARRSPRRCLGGDRDPHGRPIGTF